MDSNDHPQFGEGKMERQYSAERKAMGQSLAKMKKARKQIEADAQLLANRIALLKQEELKAWKKIEETKKKAREVYVLKKKNQDRQHQKDAKAQQNNQKLQTNQHASAEVRRQREMEKQNMREALQQQKKEEMLAIKREKEQNEKRKKEAQQRMLYQNKLKHQSIKEQEVIGSMRKKEYFDIKQRKYQMENSKRVGDEENAKQKRELEVLNMEKLEMELIQKLQHTQMLQKAAYEELESALADPTEEFMKKFGGEPDLRASDNFHIQGRPNQGTEEYSAKKEVIENERTDDVQGDEEGKEQN